MIHYELCCAQDHGFDAWFRDSAAFEEQAARALLSCPICGDAEVRRALMAPNLGARQNRRASVPKAPPSPAPAQAADQIPDGLRADLQRLREHVERCSEDVGSTFADRARAMHRGVEPHVNIRGRASDAEAEALTEEGVSFARIPWLPRADS